MPINSKRVKKGFNWGKTQQIPKVKHQEKSSYMSFGVYNKASSVFKRLDWLFIKEKVKFALWPMLREFWSWKLTWLYVNSSTKTTRGKEIDK